MNRRYTQMNADREPFYLRFLFFNGLRFVSGGNMPASDMGWNPTSGEDGETRLRGLALSFRCASDSCSFVRIRGCLQRVLH
jgi:hypothetical protein